MPNIAVYSHAYGRADWIVQSESSVRRFVRGNKDLAKMMRTKMTLVQRGLGSCKASNGGLLQCRARDYRKNSPYPNKKYPCLR